MKKKVQLLIVEDDHVQRLLIGKILDKSADWLEFVSEASVAAAQASLYNREFDIVISDYILPDGKGTELIDKEKYPLIVMTSQGSQQIAAEIMKSGAHDYLVKSQDLFNELAHVVERALREWNLEKQNKLIQETLNKSESMFSQIFEQFPLPLIITDSDFKISTMNSLAEEFFGNNDGGNEDVFSICRISESVRNKMAKSDSCSASLKHPNGDLSLTLHRIVYPKNKKTDNYLFVFSSK